VLEHRVVRSEAGAGPDVAEVVILGRLARTRITSIRSGRVFVVAVIGGSSSAAFAG